MESRGVAAEKEKETEDVEGGMRRGWKAENSVSERIWRKKGREEGEEKEEEGAVRTERKGER